MKTERHSGLTESTYRSCTLTYNHFTGQWFVTRDTRFVSYAKSENDARRIVDGFHRDAKLMVQS